MTPKIITRYILRELFTVFSVSALCFCVLMMFAGMVREALDNGLTPLVIARLLPYALPKALMFALPATVLFCVCSVYGRLVANNEATAVKAAGISTFSLIRPALVFAFCASLLAVWVNDVGFAWSYWGIERTVLKSAKEVVYGVLRSEGRFQTDVLSMEVSGVDGDTLYNPRIEMGRQEKVRIQAASGRLISDPETLSMSIQLRDGVISSTDASVRFPDELTQDFPLVDPEQRQEELKNPDHLFMRQLPAAARHDRAQLRRLHRWAALTASMQLLSGDLVGLTSPEWKTRTDLADGLATRLHRMTVVPHRRWANGFSCLAFAVIGVPVSMRLGKADFSTTFGICFLPILLTYYPVFMLGLDGAKNGTLPAFAPWLGNALCFVVGGFLLYRESQR